MQRNRTQVSRLSRFGVSLVALCCPSIVLAQAAEEAPVAPASPVAEEDSGQVRDIVVTAQRRAERLQDVPIAVTAITPAALDQTGTVTSKDLPLLAPGLSVASTSQANVYFTPVLRGVGAPTPAVGNDNSVALYVDGIYQSDKTASVFDFAGVERVEILKGPQGTLFGRNATGGAINIVTRQPSSDPQLEARGSFGRFNQWSASLYGTGPIAPNLSANIAYQHRGGGDFLRNINPLYAGKFGGDDSDTVQAKLLWNPGQLEVTASVIFVDRSTSNLEPLSPVAGSVSIGQLFGGVAAQKTYEYAGSPVSSTVRLVQPSLRIRYSFPHVDLVLLTGFVDAKATQNYEYDGTSANLFFFRNRVKVKDFSQELQLLSTGSGALQWVLGLYYYHGDPKTAPLFLIQNAPSDVTIAQVPSISGASVTVVNNSGKVEAKAAYGQATWEFTPGTKITAGLRYTEEQRGYEYSLQGIGTIAPGFVSPTLIPLGSATLPRATFKKPTWRLALDHEFAPDIMGYVSYNRGFKSGLYNFSDFTPGQQPVRPEVLDAFELGLKTRTLDNRLQFNAAAFYYKYKDIQVSRIEATGTSVQRLENAGKEEIYGVDADLIFRVTRDFQLRANGAWLHARYKKSGIASRNFVSGFTIDAQGLVSQATIYIPGQPGLLAPKISFNLGADYTLRLQNGGNIQLNGNYFYTDGYKTVFGTGNDVFSHDLIGASATYNAPGGRYFVTLWGKNLGDRHITARSTSPFRLGRFEIMPITYGVTAGVNF